MRISNEEFSYTLNDQSLGASLSFLCRRGQKVKRMVEHVFPEGFGAGR